MNEIPIPRYIDSQMQFFFWELDEVIVFFSGMGIGIWLGGFFLPLFMLIGYIVVNNFKKYKSGALDGVLLHIIYRAGFMSLNRRYFNGLQRETFL